MIDRSVVEATAAILFEGYRFDARRVAATLADDSRLAGDASRAEMWSEIVAALEAMVRRTVH